MHVAGLPFVKAPTAANGIGNGAWDGGLIVPVQMPVSKATLTLVPQLNLLDDAIAPRSTIAVELWTPQNWDPAGTARQYSADAALAYLLTGELQLDVGGNFGLNQATPDVQIYAVISARF